MIDGSGIALQDRHRIRGRERETGGETGERDGEERKRRDSGRRCWGVKLKCQTIKWWLSTLASRWECWVNSLSWLPNRAQLSVCVHLCVCVCVCVHACNGPQSIGCKHTLSCSPKSPRYPPLLHWSQCQTPSTTCTTHSSEHSCKCKHLKIYIVYSILFHEIWKCNIIGQNII